MKQGKKRIHIYKVLPNKDVCLCHLGIDLTPKIGVKLRAGGVGQRLRVPAQLIRLCLTLCKPIDCSPPGSSVHGILQARKLESERKIPQSCLTLCNPMDWSLLGSSVHGIFQARVLEWVAIAFSKDIFPTQGWNPGLLHCRQTLYRLSHLSLRKPEWVAISSFRRLLL